MPIKTLEEVCGIPDDEGAKMAQDLVDLIAPMLTNQNPIVISAALADLMAIVLAGFQHPDAAEKQRVREEILQMHVGKIRELIPVNETIINERVSELIRKGFE